LKIFFRAAAVLAALSFYVPAGAQQITGSISGTITDKSGSVIAGVTVKLISESTSAAREAGTNADGAFEFSAISTGRYRISVRHAGFKTAERGNIELAPNQSLAIGAIALDVGDVSESVTVKADVAVVQTASGERSGLITSEEVENLTVINRDFATLVALLPGVVDSPGTAEVQGFSGGATFNVGGNRANGNSITIDGGSIENSNGGNGNNFVSMDSIQAVRIVTSNYQAEFGRKPGAGIMAVTKGGTKSFHGAAYWYYRHEWMNANQFFNNRAIPALPQTPRRVQTPGFNIGGPAYIPGTFNSGKNKLFFFASLEFIRERRPQDIRNLTVPTDLEIAGDFSKSFNSSGARPIINDPLNGKTPFPGNVIPTNQINAAGKAYLKLLPRPDISDITTTKYAYNYQTQESLNIPKVSHSFRVDYILDDKTTIWLKYNFWWEDQQGWAVSAGNSNWGWMPSHYKNHTHAPVLSLTRIISPRMILEASGRLTRWIEDGSALNTSDYDRLNRQKSGANIPQFWPGNNPHDLVPNATFGGVISNAVSTSLNARFPLRGAETPVFADATLTNTRGPHVMKYGLYVERWSAVKGEQGNWNGTLDFTTDTSNPGDANHPFANALLGNFKSYTEASTRPPLYEGTTSIESFVQDNWKISRRLTLDLGMRIGWSQPWHSLRRQEAGFLPGQWNPANTIRLMIPVRVGNARMAQDPVTGAIYPATVIGAIAPNTGDPYNGTVNLLTNSAYPQGLRENSGVRAAPRFGFAWDPTGKGRMAIRGGFGVFYEMHEKDLWSYHIELDPPNQLSPQIFYGNLGSFINTSGFLFPSSTHGMTPNRNLARTMSYSFGVQRNVGAGVIVDASYVGTLGRHLLAQENLNSIAANTTYLPSAQDPSNPGNALASQYLRPYLGYGDILFYDYVANSSYHSLQVTANRRFTKNVSGGLAWTWSKAMDYADNDTTNLSMLESARVWNYGLAGYDRTHILKGNWIWQIPSGSKLLPKAKSVAWTSHALLDGWQLSGITTVMSGAPQSVTLSLSSGSANNWSGSPTDAVRTNLVGNPVMPKDQRTFSLNVNPAAFALPPAGTLGNASKAVFRGPGRNNWDISTFKNFMVTERLRAQFRFEAYNVFNHTQFTTLDTTIKFSNAAATYGQLLPTTFGQFTAAGLARRMQVAMRVTF
jgi:hypothetical protein